MQLAKDILGLPLPYKTRAEGVERNIADHGTYRSRIVDHLEIVPGQAVSQLNIFAAEAKHRIEHPIVD
jgi:hypothetical protein